MQKVTAKQLDSVQLLRGTAAVAVVTHHIPVFGNGAWGVDLFFVISGFIMCYVTASSRKHFLLKRIIRVIPLYWIGTFGVFLIAQKYPHLLNNTTANGIDLIQSLTFIPFKKGNLVQPILFLGWTLNYEMFFYALFATSMYLSYDFRAVICSCLILGIVSIGRMATFGSIIVQFYSAPILLEFVFGMICYNVLQKSIQGDHREVSGISRFLWSIGAIALIACMPISSRLGPDVDRVIKYGILATLIFCCTLRGLSGVRLPRIAVAIGDASYSLYLFHPYVIQACDKIFNILPDRAEGLTGYGEAVGLTALCVGLSIQLYKKVEHPLTEALRASLIDRRNEKLLEHAP